MFPIETMIDEKILVKLFTNRFDNFDLVLPKNHS